MADIVPALARELLLAPDPPMRLPTVRELAVRHRASLSSIHTAMGRLREAGAIEVETRRVGARRLEADVRVRLRLMADPVALDSSTPLHDGA